MRECLLFALPSRYEALGCVYLEAMSCGKAAIGCRGQGIDEVIEHGVNGWLVDPENLDQLTQAILEFTRNEFLRKSMGIAARETILGGFTLAHQAESLAEVYREYVS
jgi:glycosyltransferase involved in cell wall biosynthesis